MSKEDLKRQEQVEFEEHIADGFLAKMKQKLDKHRPDNPHSWITSDPDDLYYLMEGAMEDGDWVTVANYAMMLDNIESPTQEYHDGH